MRKISLSVFLNIFIIIYIKYVLINLFLQKLAIYIYFFDYIYTVSCTLMKDVIKEINIAEVNPVVTFFKYFLTTRSLSNERVVEEYTNLFISLCVIILILGSSSIDCMYPGRCDGSTGFHHDTSSP